MLINYKNENEEIGTDKDVEGKDKQLKCREEKLLWMVDEVVYTSYDQTFKFILLLCLIFKKGGD